MRERPGGRAGCTAGRPRRCPSDALAAAGGLDEIAEEGSSGLPKGGVQALVALSQLSPVAHTTGGDRDIRRE